MLAPDEKSFARFFLIYLGIYIVVISFGYLLSMLITPYLIRLFNLPT